MNNTGCGYLSNKMWYNYFRRRWWSCCRDQHWTHCNGGRSLEKLETFPPHRVCI